jgi:hypothetical protein
MQAWKQNDNTNFNFYNAHELNRLLPISSEETIKGKLRERLLNTKMFIVLIGKQTRYLYKFVRWEMEQALKLNIPIIGVNLNGKRRMDTDLCPPNIRNELAIYISFNASMVQFALENWEQRQIELKRQGKSGPYYYSVDVYERFGL